MLEIRNIQKSFGSLEVLKGIDLTVEKGDVVAIIGPSGSGKTTLLRCMNFLENAGNGTMIFDRDHFDMGCISKKEISRLRKKTAFVFQNYNLFRNRTALENVTEGLIVGRKIPKAQAIIKARQALDKVGMLDRENHYPHQLSGGQQQRVAIARALAAKPAILLADEPTGNLDSRASDEIMTLLAEANRKYKQTIIMITHNPELAKQADRVLTIEDGRIREGMSLRAGEMQAGGGER